MDLTESLQFLNSITMAKVRTATHGPTVAACLGAGTKFKVSYPVPCLCSDSYRCSCKYYVDSTPWENISLPYLGIKRQSYSDFTPDKYTMTCQHESPGHFRVTVRVGCLLWRKFCLESVDIKFESSYLREILKIFVT